MIILAATPIGNLGDASDRLRAALSEAPVVAAEDTRTAIKLMRALGVDHRPRLIALHEHNEREIASEVLALAEQGDVLVVSDAGMPTLSDPGFVLVRAAIERGIAVTCLPGPSAILTALALSGLATDRFAFDGFLPRKGGERRSVLARLAAEQRTTVVFESPHRLADALADIDAVLPGRHIAVCRELTKRYEEVRRGTAAKLREWAEGGVKGEIVIVIGGAAEAVADEGDAVARVKALVASGTRLKEASATVAAETGLARKALYDAVLAARQ